MGENLAGMMNTGMRTSTRIFWRFVTVLEGHHSYDEERGKSMGRKKSDEALSK